MSNLTEEQKRRIEQEEHARLAEEAYRQEIRRSLASSPTPPTPPIPPIARGAKVGPGVNLRPLIVTLVIVLVLVVGWKAAIHNANSTPFVPGAQTPSLLSTWEPVTEQIVSGQFEVPARSFRSWTITVPSGTRNFSVTGHYSAIGGGGNDIAAVIATEDEFQNWINGHQSRIFYASPGTVTTGDINIKGLPPGTYILAFSNKFSTFTDKAVFAEISASYEQLK